MGLRKISPMTVGTLFKAIDIDGSGGISFQEFERWWNARCRAMGNGKADAILRDARELFSSLGKDGNDLLDEMEFGAVMETLASSVWMEAVDPSSGQIYHINKVRIQPSCLKIF